MGPGCSEASLYIARFSELSTMVKPPSPFLFNPETGPSLLPGFRHELAAKLIRAVETSIGTLADPWLLRTWSQRLIQSPFFWAQSQSFARVCSLHSFVSCLRWYVKCICVMGGQVIACFVRPS